MMRQAAAGPFNTQQEGNAMDGVHEMAAEIFIRIMAARSVGGAASTQDAADAARDSYAYAKAFFEEHKVHLERGA